MIAPRIIFEDTHLIVLSKPPGLLSQGDDSGHENLVDYLRNYLGRNYIGLIHRLDRNTSGIMVVAKRSKSAQRLTESLQSGQMRRSYLALVEGSTPAHAKLEHYLVKNEKTNEVRAVKSTTAGAKRSELNYTKVCELTVDGTVTSLLHIVLETGRGHQIRVQCQAEGFSLLGDRKYGSKIESPGRPALHSYSMEFPHPMSGELCRYKDPLPEDLSRLIPKSTNLP